MEIILFVIGFCKKLYKSLKNEIKSEKWKMRGKNPTSHVPTYLGAHTMLHATLDVLLRMSVCTSHHVAMRHIACLIICTPAHGPSAA